MRDCAASLLPMERSSSVWVSIFLEKVLGNAEKPTRVKVLVAVRLSLLVAVARVELGLRGVALVTGLVEAATADTGLSGRHDEMCEEKC